MALDGVGPDRLQNSPGVGQIDLDGVWHWGGAYTPPPAESRVSCSSGHDDSGHAGTGGSSPHWPDHKNFDRAAVPGRSPGCLEHVPGCRQSLPVLRLGGRPIVHTALRIRPHRRHRLRRRHRLHRGHRLRRRHRLHCRQRRHRRHQPAPFAVLVRAAWRSRSKPWRYLGELRHAEKRVETLPCANIDLWKD